jgi:hypothetical protein
MKRITAALGAALILGAFGCDYQNGPNSSAVGDAPLGRNGSRSAAATGAQSPTARGLSAAAPNGSLTTANGGLQGRQLFDGDSRGGFSFGAGDAIPVSRPSTYNGPFSAFARPNDLRVAAPPAPSMPAGGDTKVAAAVRALGGNEATGVKVASYARQLGVSPALALAISQAESGIGTNNRTSAKGAQGAMQVLPGTARDLGVNPSTLRGDGGILAGVKYLKLLSSQLGGSLTNIAWGYNAGPGNVGRRLPNETRSYINTVTQAYKQLLDMGI